MSALDLVDPIPKGWCSVSLGEVATIERKSVQPRAMTTGTFYVGVENIVRGGAFNGVSTVEAGHLGSSKFAFDTRHVLFGKLRPNLGKVALPDFSGVCSTDILPVLPGAALDRSYLAHYLRQQSVVDLAASRATGANLPRLSPMVLLSFPIPLPPLAEQRRIAAILDHADALRAKRRHALDLLDTLTQSMFANMYGTPEPNWPECPVASLSLSAKGSIRTGPFGSQLLHREFVDQGVAVLGIDNAVNTTCEWGQRRYITDKKFEDLSRYRVRPRVVLITIMGTVGRCAIVPGDIPAAINTKHL